MYSKPNAIVYLRRSGLVVAGKRVAPARLNFPPELVDNLEVVQPEQFISGCQEFFAEHGIKGKRVLMVLDHSVVFTKTVELDKSGKPEAIAQAFVDAMPVGAGKRACVTIENQEQLQLYATNAELYEAVAEALRQSDAAKLLAITPAAAYELTEDKKQLAKAIEQFIADKHIRQRANFANTTAV